MALLFVDGFDTYGDTEGSNVTSGVLQAKYLTKYADNCLVEAGRVNGHSLQPGSSVFRAHKRLDTTEDTITVGLGVKLSNLSYDAYTFGFYTFATQGINLKINTSGTITVRRGTTDLGTSASSVITANTWHYIELKTKCADSGGTYEVWVDGTSVLSGTDDTKATAYAYHNGFYLAGTTQTVYYDDLYITDGTTGNLGVMQVSTLYPDGDDTTDWTATGDHYSNINEATFDGSTYVETDGSGDQDIFTYDDLSSNGAIKGLQVTTECKVTDAKNMQVKNLSKSTGNTANSTVYFGSTDYVARSSVFENDPDGSAWTQSTVNSTKFGMELV